MKREIKFRIWDTKYNKFIDYNDHKIGAMLYDDGIAVSTGYDGEDNPTWDWDIVDLLRYIEQEFTGRSDAYFGGNDVYEGDIIENCDTKDLQVVYWNQIEAAWYCKYVGSDRIVSLADSLGNLNKVVGNICQNPELVKAQ